MFHSQNHTGKNGINGSLRADYTKILRVVKGETREETAFQKHHRQFTMQAQIKVVSLMKANPDHVREHPLERRLLHRFLLHHAYLLSVHTVIRKKWEGYNGDDIW